MTAARRSHPLRVGIIGTGFGARVVAPVFAATEGCEVVDVVSARDTAAVLALGARQDLDLVSVHSPPFLHVEAEEAALVGGHAVLCDKPFGCSTVDADRMVRAARDARQVGLVNFEFRCDPARIYVRNLIRDGSLGRIEHVSWIHVSSGSRVPVRPYGWLFDRAAGGGWLGAWGSHTIDTLRWWLGDLRVTGAELETTVATRVDANGVPHAVDAEDGFRAWLETKDGATVAIDSTFAATASVAPRVVVTGASAVLEVVADRHAVVRYSDGSRDEWNRPDVNIGRADPHQEPMRRWAEVVRDAVSSGAIDSDTPTFADGFGVAQILDDIRACSRP